MPTPSIRVQTTKAQAEELVQELAEGDIVWLRPTAPAGERVAATLP